VPDDEVERALAGLSAYEKENPSREQGQPSIPARSPNFLSGVLVAGALVVGHFFFRGWPEIAPWFDLGRADADRILSGELWRTITALTLHADLAHVLSNAAATSIFVTVLSSLVGPGLSIALFILTGAGGNLANALVQGTGHVSVGASTAIFGIVGVIGAIGVMRRRQESYLKSRAWIPLASAVALLAMLGTGTGRVDVLAHFFGFVFGAVAGVIVAFILREQASPRIQWLCGTAAISLLLYCWVVALN
jgi:membrane associated rhomboid family serine protease